MTILLGAEHIESLEKTTQNVFSSLTKSIDDFKETVSGTTEKMNQSSNKMLVASRFYFAGSLLLTILLIFVGANQGRIMNKNSKIMEAQTKAMHKQVMAINEQSQSIKDQTAVQKRQAEAMIKQCNQSLPLGSAEKM